MSTAGNAVCGNGLKSGRIRGPLGGADAGGYGASHDVGGDGLHRVGRSRYRARGQAEHRVAVVEGVCGAHRTGDAVVRDRGDPVRLLLGEPGIGDHRTDGRVGAGYEPRRPVPAGQRGDPLVPALASVAPVPAPTAPWAVPRVAASYAA